MTATITGQPCGGFWWKCLLGCLLVMCLFVISMHYHFWSTISEYSFGYLVPAFAAFVIYDRWPLIRKGFFKSPDYTSAPLAVQKGTPLLDAIAFCGILCALFFLLAGSVSRAGSGANSLSAMLLSLALSTFGLCSVWLISGIASGTASHSVSARIRFTALFLFPALIWLISAPLAPAFEQVLRVFLLSKVTHIVVFFFDFMGTPIIREGTILILPNGCVGVEDACSGIRSLTGCIFAGSFLCAVFLEQLWRKVFLVVAAMILAFVTNIGRSLFLTTWAYNYGSKAIDEPAFGTDTLSVHDVAGFAVLGITCVGLLLLLPIFQISANPPQKNK